MKNLDLQQTQPTKVVESTDAFLRRHGWVIFSRKKGASPKWKRSKIITSQETALRISEGEEKGAVFDK